jgi:hypothetical protein
MTAVTSLSKRPKASSGQVWMDPSRGSFFYCSRCGGEEAKHCRGGIADLPAPDGHPRCASPKCLSFSTLFLPLGSQVHYSGRNLPLMLHLPGGGLSNLVPLLLIHMQLLVQLAISSHIRQLMKNVSKHIPLCPCENVLLHFHCIPSPHP